MRPWRSATEHRTGFRLGRSAVSGFNEAVAFCHGTPGSLARAIKGFCHASMRPWRSATEHKLAQYGLHVTQPASMRPWRSATEHWAGGTKINISAGPASMRPWRSATEHKSCSLTGPGTTSCFNEAVAFCHGTPAVPVFHRQDHRASMRPWRSATEHDDLLQPHGRGSRASMRPWRSATEHVQVTQPHARGLLCFNEAVAFCHGTRRWCSHRRAPPPRRFNEAVAFCHGTPGACSGGISVARRLQ